VREAELPSFGEKLKREREKRKISLDLVSSTTKISTRMLQALEQDKFNQLPGGIFNKGFVRAYARVVGLDEDQTVADYLEASGDAPPAQPEMAGRNGSNNEEASESPSRPSAARRNQKQDAPRRQPESDESEAPSDSDSRQIPWGIFAIVLLIIALLLTVWSQRRKAHERQSTPPVPTASESTSSTSAPVEQAAMQQSAVPTPAKTATQAAAIVSPAKNPTQSVTQNPPAVATPSGTFTLVIKAREDSWLSLIVDGKSQGSDTLIAKGERTVFAHRAVVVKAGNAGAIDLLLNGKPLPAIGSFGEVKTVTIGPSGLLPTPPTSTPSP
jgi:cytoskeletal protein RodZ